MRTEIEAELLGLGPVHLKDLDFHHHLRWPAVVGLHELLGQRHLFAAVAEGHRIRTFVGGDGLNIEGARDQVGDFARFAGI